MGTDIGKEEFDERDYSRFAERLEECRAVLAQLLNRPGFGTGPATIGAELELFLIDGAGRPPPHNQAIRAAVADPRVTVELDRFNLEINASPAALAGRPFTALGGELNLLVDRVADAAEDHAGRPALIGILPTLSEADFGPGAMTDLPRYRVLDGGLRRRRQDRFRIQIAGEHPLELATTDVALEGANSSFQVHLRVAPGDFTRTCNAVQLATAPVLAVSGNSPTFLGHRLWEETRIAVFKQSVDDRPGYGPAAGRPAPRWERAGCAAGRWNCLPKASGCTSRCCRYLAVCARWPAAPGSRHHRWMSSGCTKAPCGAGTGPSATPPGAGICESRCGPCPPAPP